jgi:hypothetical protein
MTQLWTTDPRCRTAKPVADRHAHNGQGMNWLQPAKRIALYLRDGLACVYCESGIEDGAKLTLDHLVAHADGGSNHEANLVTCCHKCNSSRGSRDVAEFAEKVAGYLNHGAQATDILTQIETTRNRAHDAALAKSILAARGGFTAALQGLKS